MTHVIAEIGVNHMGRVDLAREMIQDVAACGAWGVKFQLYVPELLDARKSVQDQLRGWMLTKRELMSLRRLADRLGLAFGASCFDNPSVELLRSLGPDFQKTACGQWWPGMKRLPVPQFQSYTRAVTPDRGVIPLLCVPRYPACVEDYLPIPYWARGISDHCASDRPDGSFLSRGLGYAEVHVCATHDAPDRDVSIYSHALRRYIANANTIDASIPMERTKVKLKRPIKGQTIAWLRGVKEGES
jgi:sialic acid synthase SpsE